jgi:hypothetical protein
MEPMRKKMITILNPEAAPKENITIHQIVVLYKVDGSRERVKYYDVLPNLVLTKDFLETELIHKLHYGDLL